MRIKVKFFAAHREIAGVGKVMLDLRQGSAVKDALSILKKDFPGLATLTDTITTSINKHYSNDDTVLQE